jgi:hypothetical protein
MSPLYIGAFIAPTIGVFAGGFLGQGARTVSAAEEPFQVVSIEPMSFRLDRLEEPLSSNDFIPSPFYFESQLAPIDPVVEPTPRATQRPTGPAELPPVRVTSILPNGKTPLAIIDGKPRRVGDTLESGWKVLSINGDDFTVTLVHSSGQKVRAGIQNH